MAEQDSNIKQNANTANAGLNLDSTLNQVPKGKLTYALNAMIENFDNSSTNYQNEPGNEKCLEFPEGYQNIGNHFINEMNKHIFFLANPETGKSEIGYMDNNDCIYRKYINADCLNFSIYYPIHKSVHKITNCSTEIYWTDGLNPRRYLDLTKLPYKIQPGTAICDNKTIQEIDCNKLNIQPDFSIPQLEIIDVISGGNLIAGTYQFAIQYSDSIGDGYTSYYSITNPLPIADLQISTLNFNYPVGKSIVLNISDIDITGYYKYFNIAVIKTVNSITSVELIGTYFIDGTKKEIVYTGQNVTQIQLTTNDIFEKFPYYEIADDITAVQDILVWKGLTSIDRINYQKIANKIKLQWETYRIPADENYSDELNATNLRGYLRDEVYAFEIVFLLKNGKQSDGFHIPGITLPTADINKPFIYKNNPDFIGDLDDSTQGSPYWKIYNTASVLGTSNVYLNNPNYKGPYQYGDFAYWESIEVYPCNVDVWGELANQPIRHHKFPDVLISPIFESAIFTDEASMVMQKDAVFPIGVKLDINQINSFIIQSDLTKEQKNNIAGFKIVRGDRSTNKSIIAKGILRNVGKYEKDGREYYFPNYPYNDLRQDPFLLEKNNGYNSQCNTYIITTTVVGGYQYTDCFSNVLTIGILKMGVTEICSTTTPIPQGAVFTVILISYDTYILSSPGGFTFFAWAPAIPGEQSAIFLNKDTITVKVVKGTVPAAPGTFPFTSTPGWSIIQTDYLRNDSCYPSHLKAFTTDDSKYRHVFNSPETSFGQPFLGNILKLENIIFGRGKAHFTQVKKNALYRLLTREGQEDALKASALIAGVAGSSFDATAMFTAYQAYLTIYTNGITKRNYGYSYNSILNYDYSEDVPNGIGIKQRQLEIAQYLLPGVQSVNDESNVNNYQRETSVYLKTRETVPPLPYPSDSPLMIEGGVSKVTDKSRFINSEKDCSQPEKEFDISSVVYYASIKNNILNQWGQIYSYDTIDTGFQTSIDTEDILNKNITTITIFGGDTFINKFAFKTKLPFFIDNRVGDQDDSDIYYDEIGNIAYPEFWHSARNILYDYTAGNNPNKLLNIISIKAHNFDCPNSQLQPFTNPVTVNPGRSYYDGKMYLFAYGVPNFYCESSINVDLRQAFNSKEGDFYPHVSTNIPDDWVQESNVPIALDNTYTYNISYSKQNKENYFSHLPVDWKEQLCFTNFPFRAIYSDKQESFSDNKINSWLIYRPISYFDFPQNYGKLITLDGIQNRAVLARFENKSLLYNTLLTVSTSNPQAAYLGNDSLFRSSPPVDFAETDLGYVGSQHKFLLKIPQGQITIDAKRGQVFLISDNSISDLSAFGTGLNRFLTNHLPFQILKSFPNIVIDNHFNGIGIHGVYDNKYDRVVISKLDYIPLTSEIKYNSSTKEFYIDRIINDLIFTEIIDVTDSDYFCNKSWTLSFNLNTQSWISFHSYIPNWYVAENNFFYSGINDGCDLEAIAGEELDCSLEGFAYQADCVLQGISIYIG